MMLLTLLSAASLALSNAAERLPESVRCAATGFSETDESAIADWASRYSYPEISGRDAVTAIVSGKADLCAEELGWDEDKRAEAVAAAMTALERETAFAAMPETAGHLDKVKATLGEDELERFNMATALVFGLTLLEALGDEELPKDDKVLQQFMTLGLTNQIKDAAPELTKQQVSEVFHLALLDGGLRFLEISFGQKQDEAPADVLVEREPSTTIPPPSGD